MTTAAAGNAGGGAGAGAGGRTSSASSSSAQHTLPTMNHRPHCRQETHRIYLQQRRRPPPPATNKQNAAQHRRGGRQQLSSSSSTTASSGGGPTTVSAAIRLTDSATCGDVTSLLRRKFHLGPLPPPSRAVSGGPVPAGRTTVVNADANDDDGGDALVLVGTLHDLPPGHVQFFDGEHRDGLGGWAAAAAMGPCPACGEGSFALATSGSTVAAAAAGTSNGSAAAAAAQAPVPGGVASALGYGTGFFFPGSGSGGGNSAEGQKRYQQKMAAAEVVANMVEAIDGRTHSCHQLIGHNHDVSIHTVRTVRSHENPLLCRDEMVRHLRRRDRDAWDVFFSNLCHRGTVGDDGNGNGNYNGNVPAVVDRMAQARRRGRRKKGGGGAPRTTIRWFFQPRFDAGRVGGDVDGDAEASAMGPTAFVELDGYCTADDGGEGSDGDVDDCMDGDEDDESDHRSGRHLVSGRPGPAHSGAAAEAGSDREDGDADSTHAEVGRVGGGSVVDHEWNGVDGVDGGPRRAPDFDASAFHPSDGISMEVAAAGDGGRHSDASQPPSDPNDGVLAGELNGQHYTRRKSPRHPHLHPHYNPSTAIELRRRATLQRCRQESSGGSGHYSVSGFLLRQSRSDPNVWRRVYCILVDDRLWYVSRMKPLVNDSPPRGGRETGRTSSCVRPYFDDDDYDDSSHGGETSSTAVAGAIAFPTQMPTGDVGKATSSASSSASASASAAADPSSSSRRPPSHQPAFSPPRCAMCSRRIGRYRSIRLRRARVTEPPPGSPHSTLPNGIVVRESRSPDAAHEGGGGGGGVVLHHFRADGRDAQLRWIQALADRMVTLHEDGYMDLAECIVFDAEGGRARRMEREVVAPCAGMVVPPPDDDDDVAAPAVPVPGADRTGGIVPRRMGGGRRTRTTLWSMTGNGAEFVDLVRFGMLVQAYREKCRHYEEWCRHGGIGVGVGHHGSDGHASNGGTHGGGGGGGDKDDGATASVKAIKLARRGRLEESIRLIGRLWEEAAHVCSMSDVSVSVSSSTERGAEEMEQALRRIDTLRAEITFRVQENADCGLRAYKAILTDDGRGLPAPPPTDLFDEMVRRRIELVQMVEKRYEEHGLFGHDSSML